MTPERITQLALANGFKLKEQPDGSQALNPYVFDLARALLAAQQAELDALNEIVVAFVSYELTRTTPQTDDLQLTRAYLAMRDAVHAVLRARYAAGQGAAQPVPVHGSRIPS